MCIRDSRKVPLNYVAEVVSAMGPNTINRETVKRKIVISANVADRDLLSVVNDIQKRIDTSIPVSYTQLDVYKRQ